MLKKIVVTVWISSLVLVGCGLPRFHAGAPTPGTQVRDTNEIFGKNSDHPFQATIMSPRNCVRAGSPITITLTLENTSTVVYSDTLAAPIFDIGLVYNGQTQYWSATQAIMPYTHVHVLPHEQIEIVWVWNSPPLPQQQASGISVYPLIRYQDGSDISNIGSGTQTGITINQYNDYLCP